MPAAMSMPFQLRIYRFTVNFFRFY